MPRASNSPRPTAGGGGGGENVSSNSGHAEPSCSTPAHHHSFRPVTRSMTRPPAAIVASPHMKEGEPASPGSCITTKDPCFSIQLAASRPTVTRGRTPRGVTSSAWKPLTQPAVLSEGPKQASTNLTGKRSTLNKPAVRSEDLKRASAPSTNLTAKRSRVASSQVAKDSTNRSEANRDLNVPGGKKNRDGECAGQGDKLDRAVIPCPQKKQKRGESSGVLSKRKSAIRNLDSKLAAPLGMVKTETVNNPAGALTKMAPASTNDVCQSAEAVVPSLGQQLKPATPKKSNVITEAVPNEKSSLSQSVAPDITKAIAIRTNQINNLIAPDIAEAISIGTSQGSHSVAPVTTEAIANRTRQVNQSAAPFFAKKAIAIRTSHISEPIAPVTTEAIASGTHQVNKLVGPVVTLPRQNLEVDVEKKFSKLLMTTGQVSGPAGETGPVAPQKLQIGNVKNSSNALSDHAYRKALLIKQQEQLLQQYKLARAQPQLQIKGPALLETDEAPPVEPLGTRCQVSGPADETGPLAPQKLQIGNVKNSSNVLSDPAYRKALLVKQQEQLLQQYKLASAQPQLHIEGPALLETDEAPPVEPLGTRCQLCKIDVAYRQQGDSGRDTSAPPVVAVLACHHAFHSSCIESVYGLAEPSQCIACLDSVKD